MRIFVPNLNKGGIGGGPTFVQNFSKGMSSQNILQDQIEQADLMFVPNPMWAERSDFEAAKAKDIPIVLRLDNIPEDWNNRGTAITKLKDFIEQSDILVFQSAWAEGKYKEFISSNHLQLKPLCHSTVVHNGVDTKMFSPASVKPSDKVEILFVKSGRNENKRYPEAMEIFRRYWQRNKESRLTLVGQFADDYHKYNFGFYNGENYQYVGMGDLGGMPSIYQQADILLFPAYADCAPNVVLEAMACGVVPIIHPYGGGAEFVDDFRLGVNLQNYEGDYLGMINEALAIDQGLVRGHIENSFSLETMINNYEGVFNALVGN